MLSSSLLGLTQNGDARDANESLTVRLFNILMYNSRLSALHRNDIILTLLSLMNLTEINKIDKNSPFGPGEDDIKLTQHNIQFCSVLMENSAP